MPIAVFSSIYRIPKLIYYFYCNLMTRIFLVVGRNAREQVVEPIGIDPMCRQLGTYIMRMNLPSLRPLSLISLLEQKQLNFFFLVRLTCNLLLRIMCSLYHNHFYQAIDIDTFVTSFDSESSKVSFKPNSPTRLFDIDDYF